MTVEHVAVRYGSLKVLKDVNFITRRGDRIVIVGRERRRQVLDAALSRGNAEGPKRSREVRRQRDGGLLRAGERAVGLRKDRPRQLGERHRRDRGATTVAAGRLRAEGIGGAPDASTLSGGERAKLALAILASSDANLLLLDEPTNNLDPASVLALGDMMHKWKGTIVAVSHERGFVETLEPTHAVLLPEEYFDLWNDDYMDLIEQR